MLFYLHESSLLFAAPQPRMSATSSPVFASGNEKTSYHKDDEKVALGEQDVTYEAASIDKGEDILSLNDIDPALNAKMHLVNNVR